MKSGIARGPIQFEASQAIERIRERWLANAIHELKNPLFVARGYVRLLLESPENSMTDSNKRYLMATLENISRIDVLTKKLYEFPGYGALQLGSVNFRELLQHAIARIGPMLAQKAVTITQVISGGSLLTIGDREKLLQSLNGFLSAAARFVRPGNMIEITVDEADDKITLRLNVCCCDSADFDSSPDLSVPCSLWRLHGGVTSIHRSSEGRYSLICELPVIWLPQ